jgi:limonene-1,2-epoxide hydrolase
MTPVETVQAFIAALERLDFEAALDFCADSIEYQNVPLPADHGKAAVLATLRRFSLLGNEFKVEMKNIALGQGRPAAATPAVAGPSPRSVSPPDTDGTVLTERIDILAGPGIRLEFWVCGTFEVKNGKIALWRDYFDWATMAAQIAKNLPGFATVGLFQAARRRIGF